MPLLDKLKIRIQAWGEAWLNLAGKVTLLKYVLSSIPIYQNTIMLAPKSFISKVDALLRIFLWEGGKSNKRRLHLVSWDKIKKPILEGGLHIQNIVVQNLALGSKLLWNLVSGHTSWSKKVIWKK